MILNRIGASIRRLRDPPLWAGCLVATVEAYGQVGRHSVRQETRAFVARYPGKSVAFLREHFDVDGLLKRFGRVEDFDPASDCRDWTFWTYARRAAEKFGPRGHPIYRQMRRHRDVVVTRVEAELGRRQKPKKDPPCSFAGGGPAGDGMEISEARGQRLPEARK